jgi:polyisoprenoid-binding protein YceI
MRYALIAAAAIAFALPASAATKWTPDYSKSRLQFEGKYGQNTVTGTFGKFAADIQFDAADLATSKVSVTVDIKSVATKVTPDAHFEKPTDGALPGAGWFNAAQFGTATFVSTSIVSTGGNKYEAKGKLTLRGVSKDITLPFTVTVTGNTAVAEGDMLMLNRMDFGIKGDAPQYMLPKPVPHEVKVQFSVTATK